MSKDRENQFDKDRNQNRNNQPKDRNQDQNQNRPTGGNRDFDQPNKQKKDYNNPDDRNSQ